MSIPAHDTAPSHEDVVRWLSVLCPPPHAIELRAFGGRTVVSRFAPGDFEGAARRALWHSGRVSGVFVAINGVDPAMPTGLNFSDAAKATDIPARRRLLIDCDPIRPSNTNATGGEKDAARRTLDAIRVHLDGLGWPAPIVADSGNGWHLIYAIDLPNDRDSTELVKAVLKELGRRFGDGAVKVDDAVSDPSRLTKCYGTITKKGEHTTERPHRYSRVESLPDRLEPVPVDLLRALAGVAPQPSRGLSARVPAPTGGDGHERWFRAALDGEAGKVAMASEGTRNNTLNKAAFTLGGYLHHGYLDEHEVVATLTHAASRAGLSGHEVERTIRSGLDKGRASPMPMPDALREDARAERVATEEHDDDDEPLPMPSWPDPPSPEAYYGLLGECVRAVEEQTEADPAAILGTLLVAFGNVVGRGPHVMVDGARHGTNQFLCLVGETAAARKGTSKARALEFLDGIDEDWRRRRVLNGLSSGEGLIAAVRDATEKDGEVIDHGEPDKRLLVIESELGSVLRALQRDGNRLSAMLRSAWDGDDLRTMTKVPYHATAPHVSLVGHVTFRELETLLSMVEVGNGLANRVPWLCVRRSRVLPFGGEIPDLGDYRRRLADALDFARGVGRMDLTPAARAMYDDAYRRLSSPPPGIVGEVTSRAPAHVLRFAIIYALADHSKVIDAPHVGAAVALVDASCRAAAHIFGDGSATGDKDADRLLDAIRTAPEGLTRTGVYEAVKSWGADRRRAALGLLVHHGLVSEVREPGPGRTAFRYRAVGEKGGKGGKGRYPTPAGGLSTHNTLSTLSPDAKSTLDGDGAREVVRI